MILEYKMFLKIVLIDISQGNEIYMMDNFPCQVLAIVKGRISEVKIVHDIGEVLLEVVRVGW